MDRTELKSLIATLLKQERIDHLSLSIKKKNPEIYSEIINYTNYLTKNCKFTERLYNILNNLKSIQSCNLCGNSVRFKNFTSGYSKFCSARCSNKSEETQKKKSQTKLQNFGNSTYNNPKQNKQTKLEKYGNENYRNEEKIFETKLKKYGNRGFCNPDKTKKTKKLRYGNETYVNPEKTKITLQNHPEITTSRVEKFKQTLESNPEITEKRIKKLKESLWRSEFKKILSSPQIQKRIIPKFKPEDYLGNKIRTKKKVTVNTYLWGCVICGCEFSSGIYNGKIPKCPHCFPTERFTIPHKKVSNFLLENNIQHKIENRIGKYWVDIFIEPNKIIEVYGDYWHGNPKFYKKGQILNLSSGKILVEEKWEKDQKRLDYLEKKGKQVTILWEDEINNDWEFTKERILNFLEN